MNTKCTTHGDQEIFLFIFRINVSNVAKHDRAIPKSRHYDVTNLHKGCPKGHARSYHATFDYMRVVYVCKIVQKLLKLGKLVDILRKSGLNIVKSQCLHVPYCIIIQLITSVS